MLRAAWRRLQAAVWADQGHIQVYKRVKGRDGWATKGNVVELSESFGDAVRQWRDALVVVDNEPIPAQPAIAAPP
jgi:hypothetical protein